MGEVEFHEDVVLFRGGQIAFVEDGLATVCLSEEDLENGEWPEQDRAWLREHREELTAAIAQRWDIEDLE